MKVYVLASVKMDADEASIKRFIKRFKEELGWLVEEICFLNVTSSEASFLNDARRLVKGDPGPTFNSSFGKGHSKKSRGR